MKKEALEPPQRPTNIREIWSRFVFIVGSRKAALIIGGIVVLLGFISIAPWASLWIDRVGIDLFLRVFASWRAPHPEIAIVGIDSETLESAGTRWPWPREKFAGFLAKVADLEPKAIILDTLLQNPQGGDDGKGDRFLADELKRFGNVGLVCLIEEVQSPEGLEVKRISSLEIFRDAVSFEGFVWALVDNDGTVRSFAVRDQRLILESCAAKAAQLIEPGLKIPPAGDDGISRSLLVIPRKNGGIPAFSAQDIFEGKLPKETIAGKVVVVGVTATILHDYHPTSYGLTAGAEILAASIDTMANGRVIQPRFSFAWRFPLVAFGVVAGFLILLRKTRRSWLWSIGGLILAIAAIEGAAILQGLWIPIGPLILAWLIGSLVIFFGISFNEFMSVQLMRAEGAATGEIQRLIFPPGPLESGDFLCSGRCLPCDEAGGDYFDYFQLDPKTLVFLIGDVTGHGYSAAMVTTLVKAVVTQFRLSASLSTGSLLTTLSKVVFEIMKRKKMITLAAGRIDTETGDAEMAFGGHLPGFLVKADGSLSEVCKPSFPVGATPNLSFVPFTFKMEVGDRLILYTDGIVEAVDWQNKPFEFVNWKKYCEEIPPGKFEETWEGLLKALRLHAKGREFQDDVTLVVLERRSPARG